LTAPYKIDLKTNIPIKDEVMISSADPRNLRDKIVPIYGHKLIYLNHHYRNENTPANYLDWLDLFYESIHHPDDYHVNLNHEGIKKVVELIDYDKLSPETRHLMKIAEQRKVVRNLDQEKARKAEEKAREEGRERDREERNFEIARALKESGADINIIASSTGLTKTEIEKL
jgi:predicted transposase/invertase (TIGR01784 family)